MDRHSPLTMRLIREGLKMQDHGASQGRGAIPSSPQEATRNAEPRAKHTPEAVKAALAYHIANDLERSIANLGYAVRLGVAPHPDVCQRAAEAIVDRIKDRALELLAERAAVAEATTSVVSALPDTGSGALATHRADPIPPILKAEGAA